MFRRASQAKELLALTFDDGPHPVHTPLILEALKRSGVGATFFCVGREVERHPHLARRIVDEGHIIANHSYSHPALLLRRPARVREEILVTHDIIEKTTGVSATLFRPPYGLAGLGVPAIARQLGYDTILWSVMPRDWKNPPPQTLVDKTVSACRDGDVVLLHDGGGPIRTISEALPALIEALSARGLSCVTVPVLRLKGEIT